MLASSEPKSRILGRGVIDVSFEFFPPKTAAMEETLWRSIRRLEPLRPKYVSVTYGAGGSTRERTHATVARMLRETTLKPAAHLTCVAATQGEVDEIIRDYWDLGVRHIVALRGDPPERRRHALRADAGRLCQRRRSHHGHQGDRALRDLRRLLSGEAPRVAEHRSRYRHAEGQDRCRRGQRDHPVLLRQRGVLPLPRPRSRGRHHHPDRARHHPDSQFQAMRRLRHQIRRERSRLARPPLRRPGRRSGDATSGGRRRRRRAGARPGRSGHHRVSTSTR